MNQLNRQWPQEVGAHYLQFLDGEPTTSEAVITGGQRAPEAGSLVCTSCTFLALPAPPPPEGHQELLTAAGASPELKGLQGALARRKGLLASPRRRANLVGGGRYQEGLLKGPGTGQPREWREVLGRVEEKGEVKGGARRVEEEAEGRSKEGGLQ